jgi:hypothetical protein
MEIARKQYSDGDQIVATVDAGEVRIYTVSAKPDLRFTDEDGVQYQESMTEEEFRIWRKRYGI